MKFKLTRTSDPLSTPAGEFEIFTLEELMAFLEWLRGSSGFGKHRPPEVIVTAPDASGMPAIEIYDDHRE